MKEEKNTYIHIIVSDELKEALIKEAEEKQLSLASYIRLILLDRKKNNNN